MPELLLAQSEDMRRAVSELDSKLPDGSRDASHDDH
jgi:hypothetical protein